MDYLRNNLITLCFLFIELFVTIRVVMWSFQFGFKKFKWIGLMLFICCFINTSSFISKIYLNHSPDQYLLYILYYLPFEFYFIYYFYQEKILHQTLFYLISVSTFILILGSYFLDQSNLYRNISAGLFFLFIGLSLSGFYELTKKQTPLVHIPLFWISIALLLYALMYGSMGFNYEFFREKDTEFARYLQKFEFVTSILVWLLFYKAISEMKKEIR